MQWVKAGAVGALGSLIIFVVMFVGIHVTGVAPFNMPPSAAFLEAIGLPTKPLALIAHFGYGIVWAIILLALFGGKTDVWRGIGVAVIAQWLVLMQLIYSPIIGWGVFGTQAGTMPADAALALNSMPKYIVLTLVLHIVYGALNGWLIPKWTGLNRA
ncbi:MAG: hypothetical protein U5K99_06210 [Anaerolineales bacterium]|nr:hypothetical protein [Anaerolineales bacterium]